MNNSEAAKNLLTGTNCYECKYYIKEHCVWGYDLPKSLLCDKFINPNFGNKLSAMWNKATEADLETWFGADVEEALIKMAGEKLKHEI